MTIDNDGDFKKALSGLSPAQQRMAAARFAENVLELTRDARIKRAIESAKLDTISDEELGTAFQFAKAASVDSYTQCGHECDWNKQAGHFVAELLLDPMCPTSVYANRILDPP